MRSALALERAGSQCDHGRRTFLSGCFWTCL